MAHTCYKCKQQGLICASTSLPNSFSTISALCEEVKCRPQIVSQRKPSMTVKLWHGYKSSIAQHMADTAHLHKHSMYQLQCLSCIALLPHRAFMECGEQRCAPAAARSQSSRCSRPAAPALHCTQCLSPAWSTCAGTVRRAAHPQPLASTCQPRRACHTVYALRPTAEVCISQAECIAQRRRSSTHLKEFKNTTMVTCRLKARGNALSTRTA